MFFFIILFFFLGDLHTCSASNTEPTEARLMNSQFVFVKTFKVFSTNRVSDEANEMEEAGIFLTAAPDNPGPPRVLSGYRTLQSSLKSRVMLCKSQKLDAL